VEEHRNRRLTRAILRIALLLALNLHTAGAFAQSSPPIAGHYPPGQTGVRGAAFAAPGLSYTNFNRLFSNLEVKGANGESLKPVGEARYANVSMITWTTDRTVLGMTYGTLLGIPFATGDLTPSSEKTETGGFDLGDILVTPISLYGRTADLDYQLQFTVWSASGRFAPGAPDNRGTGFWSLVYSLGAVWYPGADRDNWSLSAVARFEQNFEQRSSGITPGNDLVVDWGLGKMLRVRGYPVEVGVSGFGVWQLSRQSSGNPNRYRYYGIGPEFGITLSDRWAVRARAHWEFATQNAIQGNNIWLIVNYRLY
jgi:hypothetical protein